MVECYIFTKNKTNGAIEVIIDRKANGYRMLYIRKLLIVSGFKDGLIQEEYEKENTNGIKKDLYHFNILTVYEGHKNKYGIYDVLGNIYQL